VCERVARGVNVLNARLASTCACECESSKNNNKLRIIKF